MSGETLQSLERCLLVIRAAEHAYENACVAKIGRNVDGCHGDEADDARVLCRLREKRRDFRADRFGYAVGASSVTQWRLTRACARPAPCGSTRAHRRP